VFQGIEIEPLTEAEAGMVDTGGAEFARALAAEDSSRILALVHPEVDFRGLTPNRSWEASDPRVEQQAYLSAGDGSTP
jgi:hypothetical protein